VKLVVTEGNYLLLDQGPWAHIKDMLDQSWFVHVPEAEQKRRLVARHMHFGRSAAAAEAWVENTDMPNARLIAASAPRADLFVTWNGE